MPCIRAVLDGTRGRTKVARLTVAGCVLIVFIGLCHEFVGAVVFPWGPAVLGGPLGWHALGLGGTALALLLLGAVLGQVRLPVAPMALVVAALGVLVCHRRTG